MERLAGRGPIDAAVDVVHEGRVTVGRGQMAQGGVEGRGARYRRNYETLVAGMRSLGFEEYLPRERQGYIITSFRYPKHERFSFEAFYSALNNKGYVIYPGKVSNADCFRIGNIGRIFESDVRDLLRAIAETLGELGVR